jgi:peptidoglycan-N-acetylglucosamine deacetylase
MVFIHHIPSLVPKIFSKLIWHKDRDKPKVYLTFDDGPVPGITDFVLDELGKREMRATFFMVGDNIRKHPDLARRVVEGGHSVGNHTQHHVKGFSLSSQDYLQDVARCQSQFQEIIGISPGIFRPPYGQLTNGQLKSLLPDFQIYMWDVLSGDFDRKQSAEVCLAKTKKYTQNGSIIVFHDQQKTKEIVQEVLSPFLDYLVLMEFETAIL